MSRGDRYEQDRIVYERDRDYGPRGDYDRDRFVEEDRYYMRGGGGRGRDYPPDDHDRYERYDRGPPVATATRSIYEDDYVRDRRPAYEEPRYEPRREPLREPLDREFDRRVVITDRERDYRDARPRNDIFDRRPEYPPPARFEDIRRDREAMPPPPPRPLDSYDDERISERVYYRDDDRGRLPPEHVHEREIIRERERERDRSRESRAARSHAHHSRHSHSPLSSRSSSHSRSGGTSVRNEYPKKGKTRIPARLVSKKVIIDIGYPFTEEGTTIIIQRALGQEHIDEILKLSEDYIKKEVEITVPARSSAGDIVEERKEEIIINSPPPQTVVVPPPAPAPVIIDAGPRSPSRGNIEITDKTVIRESSDHHHHHGHHHHYDGALVVRPRSRSRSHSRVRSEVDEYRTITRGYDGREIVRTERMEDGQLVVYEEVTERISSHKPPRIEKDKKGRITLSLPMYR